MTVLLCMLTGAFAAPLLGRLTDSVPHDVGDPVLNTWILLHNTVTVPLTEEWLNPPVFFPARGAMAFSEHLLGLWPIAGPVIWLSGNPVLAYNLAFLLSFVLSGLGTYWLVRTLTGSVAGGIIAALAFTFSPYRTAQIPHLQVISTWGMPVALLGAYRYVGDGRLRWTALFAAGWLAVVLTNGHYVYFFGVVMGGWLVWLAVTPGVTWRSIAVLTTAWLGATAVAAATYWPYRAVHADYGFVRPLSEVLYYSPDVTALVNATADLWLWSRWLEVGDPEAQLFPGLTLVVLLATGLALAGRGRAPSVWGRRLTWLMPLTVVALAITVVCAVVGPWHVDFGWFAVSVRRLSRPVMLTVALTVASLATSAAFRKACRQRAPVLFFLAAALVCWLFALGPAPALAGVPWPHPGPYRWLMEVPGVSSLRVPARFWMPGTLMLAVAAGILWSGLMARRRRPAVAVLTLAAGAGLVLDAWPRSFVVEPAPALTHGPLPPAPGRVVLEWPFGNVDTDVAAMLRASFTGTPSANGYSGYMPPHYYGLRDALRRCDLTALDGLARFADLTVLIDRTGLGGGCADALAARASRPPAVHGDLLRIDIDRLPAPPRAADDLFVVPPASAASHFQELLPDVTDDRLDTGWHTGPQRPGDFIEFDLGRARVVTGVELALGNALEHHPRGLRIEGSVDGRTWTTLDSDPVAPAALLGALAEPQRVPILVGVEPAWVRFVRVVQTGSDDVHAWVVVEARIRVDPAGDGGA